MAVYQIGRNLYASEIISAVASVGTAYDAAKIHTHTNVGRRLDAASGRLVPFGNLEALFLEVSNIASATKLTCRICSDAGGDISVIGDVEVTIDLGVTTSTKGTSQIKIDVPFLISQNSANLYRFVKCDAGSVTLEKSQISWSL